MQRSWRRVNGLAHALLGAGVPGAPRGPHACLLLQKRALRLQPSVLVPLAAAALHHPLQDLHIHPAAQRGAGGAQGVKGSWGMTAVSGSWNASAQTARLLHNAPS